MSQQKHNQTQNIQYAANGFAQLSDSHIVHESGDFDLRHGVGRTVLYDSGQVIAQEQIQEKNLIDNTNKEISPVQVDGDFVEYNFRMLSKVLIDGWWLDFRKGAVLKTARRLFNQVTIFPDHRPRVADWYGVTKDPVWQQETKDRPAGINAVYRIDAKANPKIARGLNMGAIRHTSVGITFEAEKSHPDLDNFYFHLGEEIEGEIVRFIVKKILYVRETSLVYQGADRNAVRLQAPALISSTEKKDPAIAEMVEANQEKQMERQMEEEMKIKLTREQIQRLGIKPAKLGFEKEDQERDLDSEMLKGALNLAATEREKLNLRLEQFAGLFGLDDGFPDDFDYTAKVAELQDLLQEPKRELIRLRKQALKAYRSLENSDGDKNIVELIENANLEQARAFASKFEKDLEAKHPQKNGSRASSHKADLQKPNSKKEDTSKYKI